MSTTPTNAYEAAVLIHETAKKNYQQMDALYVRLRDTLGHTHPQTKLANAYRIRASSVWSEAENNLSNTKMPFNETVWKAGDGRQIRIKDMEDSHLVNVIWWVYEHLDRYGPDMLRGFLDEANRRKLPWTAPIPYKCFNREFR